MDLLLESKRAWLLSYGIVLGIIVCLYTFIGNNDIVKTICILLLEMELLIFISFFIIIIFEWKNGIRLVISIFYLGIMICNGINKLICKWYIILPVILIVELYMFWNIGGVINCIIASRHKAKLLEIISYGKNVYEEYRNKVKEYNQRNNLGFWIKVRIKKEPNWFDLGFNTTGLDMFSFGDALFGINTSQWVRKEERLNQIISNLYDKHDALDNNESLINEKNMIDRIKDKSKIIGATTYALDEQEKEVNMLINKSRKVEKKLLKKRL